MNLSELWAIVADEVEFSAIRASGPGGQNVNKVATALQLRFDVSASALPEPVKALLLQQRDARINKEGVIVIKAQRYRSQEMNRQDGLERLREVLSDAIKVELPRKATRPTRSSVRRRLEGKKLAAKRKASRGRVRDFD